MLVTVQMTFDAKNKDALTMYDKIVCENYRVPIDGRFEDATAAILKGIYASEEEDEEDDKAITANEDEANEEEDDNSEINVVT